MQGPELESRPEATAAPTGSEVLTKKRALLHVKQQVSALMHGEDLPEGALARETAEVPYQLPAVARDTTNCPVCERKFITHHHLMKHMGVHCGEKFPCDRCSKVLASRKMLKFHQSSCVRENKSPALFVPNHMGQSRGCYSTTRWPMAWIGLRWMRPFLVHFAAKVST